MNIPKFWTTAVLFAVCGAWTGCEPMSSPNPTPAPPTKDAKPLEKTPKVTPDKPAESPDKTEPASKDDDKKPDETKPKEKSEDTKPNDPEKSDA